MQAFGLYSHIRANRIRSAYLLAGLFLLVYVVTFGAALIGEGASGNDSLPALLARARHDLLVAAPFVTLGTVGWILIALRFNRGIVDTATGGHEVGRSDQPRLYALLENLCISRGLAMPHLEIVDDDALNAYATGINDRQYAITLTSGLVAALDDAEIEAVLGHELTHIRNGDVKLMIVAVVVAGIVSFFAELLFRLGSNPFGRTSRRDDNKGSGGGGLAIIIGIVLVAVAWAMSQMIKLALSRKREFLADAGSVELTKNPDALISALQKIDGRGEIAGVPSGIMEMCLDNPRSGFSDLFATHPPIAARIDALVRYAGGHVTEPAPVPLAPDRAPNDGSHAPVAEPTFLPPAGAPGPWGPLAAPGDAGPVRAKSPWGNAG